MFPVFNRFFHSIGLPLSIILGLFLPYGADLGFLVTPLLIFLLLCSLLKVDFWFKNFAWVKMLKVFLVIFVVTVITFFLGEYFGFEDNWLIGFVLVALAPAALSSPVIIGYLNGNIALGLQISLVTNVLSIVYIPVVFYLLFSRKIMIDPMIMMKDLALLFGIPMLVVLALRKGKIDKKVGAVVNKFSFFALCFVVWIIFSKNADFLLNNFEKYWVYFVCLFVLAALNYGLGYFISPKDKFTASISIGHKNTVLIIWLCTTFFSAQVALVPTIYIVCHHLINSLLLSVKAGRKS
jgi:BASS family bile acid:Na+ symporter